MAWRVCPPIPPRQPCVPSAETTCGPPLRLASGSHAPTQGAIDCEKFAQTVCGKSRSRATIVTSAEQLATNLRTVRTTVEERPLQGRVSPAPPKIKRRSDFPQDVTRDALIAQFDCFFPKSPPRGLLLPVGTRRSEERRVGKEC